jgi:hypothetical protein
LASSGGWCVASACKTPTLHLALKVLVNTRKRLLSLIHQLCIILLAFKSAPPSVDWHWQVVCMLYSVANLYVNMTYLPFYKPSVNIANILHGCIFLGATVFLSCAHLRGVPHVGSSSARNDSYGTR